MTCTCHPDDNPPIPCAEKYALSECREETSAGEWKKNDAICKSCLSLHHDQIDRICLTCGFAELEAIPKHLRDAHNAALREALDAARTAKEKP